MLSNFERYQRIAWAYDLLDFPFEYGRYRKIRPLLSEFFSGHAGAMKLIAKGAINTGE